MSARSRRILNMVTGPSKSIQPQKIGLFREPNPKRKRKDKEAIKPAPIEATPPPEPEISSIEKVGIWLKNNKHGSDDHYRDIITPEAEPEREITGRGKVKVRLFSDDPPNAPRTTVNSKGGLALLQTYSSSDESLDETTVLNSRRERNKFGNKPAPSSSLASAEPGGLSTQPMTQPQILASSEIEPGLFDVPFKSDSEVPKEWNNYSKPDPPLACQPATQPTVGPSTVDPAGIEPGLSDALLLDADPKGLQECNNAKPDSLPATQSVIQPLVVDSAAVPFDVLDAPLNPDWELLQDLAREQIDLSDSLIILPLDSPIKDINLAVSGTAVDTTEEPSSDNGDPPFNLQDEGETEDQGSGAGSRGSSAKARVRNPQGWKRTIRKQANSSGKQYVTSRGKTKLPKDVMEPCLEKCKRKCSQRISMDQRRAMNQSYWSIAETSRQWDFLTRLIQWEPVKRRTVDEVDTYRNISYKYHFLIDSELVQVCQVMFLNTFNISAMRVRRAMSKMMAKNGVISPDKRGKNEKRKVHPAVLASVKAHIESFPTVESHYTRKRSKKRYLDEKLNVSKMYRHYLAGRLSNAPQTATQRQYEDIFRKNYKHKLGFYKPKKDLCGRCLAWKNWGPEAKTEARQKAHDEHLANKSRAREIKNEDIDVAKTDPEICVASFDLQKVFFFPYGNNSEFIFLKKIRCFNLSIFQSVSRIGYCFVWDQTVACKGALEVSSCVYEFIKMKVKEGYKEFRFVSDNCWSQNKNGIIFSMYNLASWKFDIRITHSYLEKGHTQMECDSIHSLIERRCKNLEICSPAMWYGVIRTAKVKRPQYFVKSMTQEDFLDFKAVLQLQDTSKVPKSVVRQITIFKDTAVFKKDYDGPELSVSLLQKRAGRPVNWVSYKVPRKYTERILPADDVIKGLLKLCAEKHIPDPDNKFFYDLEEERRKRASLHVADAESDSPSSACSTSSDSSYESFSE